MRYHRKRKKKKTKYRAEKRDNGSRWMEAELLAGTNVEEVERQKRFRDRLAKNARTRRRRSRPKRRSSNEPKAASLQHPQQHFATGTNQLRKVSEETKQPRISYERKNQPRIVSEGTNRPRIVSEVTNQPTTVSEVTNQPTTVSEGTNPPPILPEGTKQPRIVSGGTNQPPIVSEGTNQPLIVSERTNRPWIVSEGTTQPPIVSEGTKQPPTVSEGTKQLRIVSEGTKQPQIVSEGTKQPQIVSEGTKQPPTVSEGTKQLRIVSEGTKQPQIVSEGTKQPQIVSEGTKQPPTVSEGTKPRIVSEGTKQPPILSEGTKHPRILSEGTKQHRIVSEETKQPLTVSEGTKQPRIVSEGTKQPPIMFEGKKQPRIVSEGTKQPRIVSEVTNQPLTVSVGTKQPRIGSEGTKQSRIVSEGTNQPPIMFEGRKQPRIVYEGTKQPPIVSEGTKQPQIVSEATKQPRIVSEGTKQPRIVSEGTKQPRIVSEGTKQPRIVSEGTEQPLTDRTVPVVQEKRISFLAKIKLETDDEDMQDDVPRPVAYSDDLFSGQAFYEQKETQVSSDNEELYWYTKSVQKFQSDQTDDVEEEIHLSRRQKEQFEKRRRHDREFYKPLITDENELDRTIKKDPRKYKRCILKIESSHKSIAKVLEKGSDVICEILINGRSKCGQCYMDDEVVVEIVNPQHAGDVQYEQVSRRGVRRDADNLAYGAVVGMYPSKRKRFKDVDYPVLLCTLDEMEDHLMKPLCKTIPKVHVMKNTIRKKYGWKVKNKVEIKRIVDGDVQYNNVMEIDPEKRDLYIFRVVLLTWSHQAIYPLGAVLDAGIGGTDFSGGLEVLCLQQQVRKLYPRKVLQEVDNLLGETAMLGRNDFTKENVFTIDPPGSKDLDDALSIKKEGEDFVVGVHIADVASVVEKGSEVDEEAKKRAVTFYPLSRRPYPMLPEPLSHRKCSLLENQTRPAVSVFFQFDKSGILRKDKDPRIERTVIKSRRQFTYSEVQKIITNTLDIHEFSRDIHHLHMIASQLRENRIGDRRLFVAFEDPRIGDLPYTEGDIKAHALVEEFMILTNIHIAKCLKSNPLYANVLILRSHKSPTRQQLAEWRNNEGNVANLVFKLQGKKTSPGHELSLEAGSDNRQQDECVVVQENILKQLARCFETEKWTEARKLACTDALHPLQCLANEHWIEMMETAEYKCAYGLNEPDVSHFDLEVTCYTHFTSPIRRYADLHVHRLLHAYLDGHPPDCTPEEVIKLCLHLTSATSRQKAFSRGCRTLGIASRLEQEPLVFRAYVNKIDSERLGLYLPSLQSISDRKQELPFSMLGVTSQPDVTTDKVTVEWNVKIYNSKDTCPVEFQTYVRQKGTTNGIFTIDISSHQLSVRVLQKDWITTLKKLSNCVSRHNFPTLSRTGVKYITSELGKAFSDTKSETKDDDNEIRSCLFQAQFSPGQVLQVQMSAKPSRGLLSPQLDLVQLTRNVTICTRHLKDSVTCLSRPATRVVRDKCFHNHDDYLDAWMPLLEMESAAEAGDSGLGTMIENVRVTIKSEENSKGSDPAFFRGTFRLPTSFCFNRCIEFGGAEPESLKDDEELNGTPTCPLDYLCIRYQLNCNSIIKSQAQASPFAPVIDTHYTWVGHAGVVSVKKVTAGRGGHERMKSGSKKTQAKAKDKKQQDEVFVEVSFQLTQNSRHPPEQLQVPEGADVFLEIMSKSEVARRAQEMLYEIKKEGCELAQALAYGTKSVPPPLDKHHLDLGKKSNCEVNVRGLSGKPLPRNNERQAEAIRTALTNTLSTIQGPPGTGKSYTGVKLVYLFNKINQQLAREDKGKKTILFCGPSNKSVDHVARILRERLGTSCPKLVRMYGSAIETKDYPIPQANLQTRRGTKDLKSDQSLQDISLHHIIRRNGNKHAEEINRLDNLFARCLKDPKRYKVTREDLERHRELVNKASVEELGNYEVILTTCAMGGNKKLVKGAKEQIFQVIIDECAMSPEPHSLVPIVANKAKQVVLIGDHKQLRPIIRCKQAAELGLDQSLFERLYKKYPEQRVFLDKQYRMHPKICEFPSRKFYDGKLITESSSLWEGEPLPFWTSDPHTQKKIPHLLVDIKGNEEMLTVSTEEGNEKSKSNVQEVDKVAEIFEYLKKEFQLDVANIKILSQYNSQRNLIEQKLSKLCENREVFDRYDQHKINVSTVVSSQGGEWDYVIVSTVRSLPSYKIEPNPTLGWCHQNMGFITDQNQVNVALTRARRGLIIVGDKELLKCDPLWKDLIESYRKEKCIKKAHEFPPPPPPPPNRGRRR